MLKIKSKDKKVTVKTSGNMPEVMSDVISAIDNVIAKITEANLMSGHIVAYVMWQRASKHLDGLSPQVMRDVEAFVEEIDDGGI